MKSHMTPIFNCEKIKYWGQNEMDGGCGWVDGCVNQC